MYNHEGYEEVPPHILDSLDRYAQEKTSVGSFLEAVLTNNLFKAVAYADPDCMRSLKKIVTYINCQMPGGCWGKPDSVREWRNN